MVFFLLDVFSIITINYMFSISSLPYVSWTPANTLKRMSVSESRKESVLHVSL